jgi:hypothetical protein
MVEVGTELGRWSTAAAAPFPGVDISPLTDASLLVNDDIAHPAHEDSALGVPIRGGAEALLVLAGGCVVSGNV